MVNNGTRWDLPSGNKPCNQFWAFFFVTSRRDRTLESYLDCGESSPNGCSNFRQVTYDNLPRSIEHLWAYLFLRVVLLLFLRVSFPNWNQISTIAQVGSSEKQQVMNHTPTATDNWLVVEPPLWKIWKSLGMMTFPIYGKS